MRALLTLAFAPAALGAQDAVFRGRVLVDGTDAPLAGATVSIDALRLSTVSDSLGRFRMPAVSPGIRTVTVKHLGFAPVTTRFNFGRRDSIDVDVLLTSTAQPLPSVDVKTAPHLAPKMAEFEGRRAEGFGRFLTQKDIEKRETWALANILRTLPGLDIKGTGRDQYVYAGRMTVAGGSLAMGGARSTPNGPPSCPAAVVVDGVMVYGAGDENEAKFNINSVEPTTLAGIEYYAGPATMPPKYNATRHTCGLLILWTK